MLNSFVESELQAALINAGITFADPIPFEKPRQSGHGHLSTTVCMSLAKAQKVNPRTLAESVVAALKLDSRFVSDVQIAGPGFINFTFTPLAFQSLLADMVSAGSALGKSTIGVGKKVNVEYVSANPTGPLHAGHGRNCAIGDSVANLYASCGYEVTREYYFNNAGNQMNLLAESISVRYKQIENPELPFPENGYKGDYIIQIAQELNSQKALVGKSQEEALQIGRQAGEDWCFTSIKKTLQSLRISHDVFFNEDTLYSTGVVSKTVEQLRNAGLAYEKDGATWFALTKLGGQQDKVIIKSTGEPTYRLPDIAYHRNKLERGFDVVVDVFGSDHIATIPDVLSGVQALGLDTSKVRVIIHQMVTFFENGEIVKFSKRSGNTYTLDDLIEEVGVDVVRFFFIMRTAGTHLEFDLNLAKEEGDKNPVFYLQYAHARISSVVAKAFDKGLSVTETADLSVLEHEKELLLIDLLSRVKHTVERACESLEPHTLAEYLREVAAAYHVFYHDCRILDSGEELEKARLLLAEITRRVLNNGLAILGVSAPQKM
ncbi:MAG: arginine--tRNA ligase [Ignavibacteria bacterium]|nr:arginine--tRNA ligase [Ignavibacteria bacterium]